MGETQKQLPSPEPALTGKYWQVGWTWRARRSWKFGSNGSQEKKYKIINIYEFMAVGKPMRGEMSLRKMIFHLPGYAQWLP